ncbi:MAG: hypothetical protein J7L45_00915 [Candidatus Aenigmarchaeota archaeon]|nr:hypothetical protein [Candidatus Aenigmarchaeota archaeon]
MMRQLAIIILLVTVLLTSGCLKSQVDNERGGNSTITQMENQADEMLEQEIEEATENMTVEDIENSMKEE